FILLSSPIFFLYSDHLLRFHRHLPFKETKQAAGITNYPIFPICLSPISFLKKGKRGSRPEVYTPAILIRRKKNCRRWLE
ncbi:hypothetical protein LINGRAHAP2_LOCUS6885, partial [Linum grandiflorum]